MRKNNMSLNKVFEILKGGSGSGNHGHGGRPGKRGGSAPSGGGGSSKVSKIRPKTLSERGLHRFAFSPGQRIFSKIGTFTVQSFSTRFGVNMTLPRTRYIHGGSGVIEAKNKDELAVLAEKYDMFF